MQNKIELLKCSQRILDKYRKFVKNNQDDSDELIQQKLTRNAILAEEMWREDNIACRHYGKLEILIDFDTYKIINIHNKINSRKFHFIDYLYKPQLERLLGIEVNR